ncbi:flavoprotein NADH-dependent oxidoreductase [Mycena vitilis]|nr:flavoprotein NADH-dependent oxidoreductase [Mycena vitilis]
MSALTRNRSTETMPNEIMLEYYHHYSEGTLISPQGTEWSAAPGIWNEAQIEGWRKITGAVHEAGSKMYIQVMLQLGRASHPDAPEQLKAGVPVYAPSAISARGGKFRFIPGEPGYVTPTEITDPTVIIAQFKQAAFNAREAGFDGVEWANGYLDSTSNQRTDKRGGTPENPLEEVWGHNVGLKISPASGTNDVGMPLPETVETFGYLLSEVEKLGIAYVAILVRYNALRDPEFDGKKRGTAHDVLETFRPFLRNTPVFVNGVGRLRGVFMGQKWISHPDLVRRISASIPLDNEVDFANLYGAEGVDPALGYLDYKQEA